MENLCLLNQGSSTMQDMDGRLGWLVDGCFQHYDSLCVVVMGSERVKDNTIKGLSQQSLLIKANLHTLTQLLIVFQRQQNIEHSLCKLEYVT